MSEREYSTAGGKSRPTVAWMGALFALVLAQLPGAPVHAGVATDFDNPDSILGAIESRGAESVVEQANADWLVLHGILKKVATGREPWLKVAAALQPGAGPAVVVMLRRALGEALGNKPENVLRIAGDGSFSLLDICAIPDTDDFRFDSYDKARGELKRRQDKLATVTGDLAPAAKTCLGHLTQAEDFLARLFHVDMPGQ